MVVNSHMKKCVVGSSATAPSFSLGSPKLCTSWVSSRNSEKLQSLSSQSLKIYRHFWSSSLPGFSFLVLFTIFQVLKLTMTTTLMSIHLSSTSSTSTGTPLAETSSPSTRTGLSCTTTQALRNWFPLQLHGWLTAWLLTHGSSGHWTQCLLWPSWWTSSLPSSQSPTRMLIHPTS